MTFDCEIIAIAHRHNDVEDKLVGAPVGMRFTKEEIKNAIGENHNHQFNWWL